MTETTDRSRAPGGAAPQAGKLRILAMVPNAATKDVRVVREAHSLRRAGHEVMLVGLRLKGAAGREAMTDEGMPVRRIDWQQRAYGRALSGYSVYVLLVILLAVAVPVIAAVLLYALVALPLARMVTALFARVTDPVLGPGDPVPGLLTLLALVIFAGLVVALARALPAIRRALRRALFAIPGARGAVSRLTAAQAYGDTPGQGGSLVETLLTFGGMPLMRMPELLMRRIVGRARTDGFVEVGRAFRPDVVHCHEVATLEAGIILKRELGCRVVYEAHEVYDDLANASAALGDDHRRIHEQYLDQVDGFVTVNELIGDYYAETYPGLPTPTIMPNSVYPAEVAYDGRLHAAAGLPPSARILLYQGGFSRNRGLDVLVEAAYALPDDWYVVMMGWGVAEAELIARRDALTEAGRDEALRRLSVGPDPLEAPAPDPEEEDGAAAPPVSKSAAEAVHRSLVAEIVRGREITPERIEAAHRSLRRLEAWDERVRADAAARLAHPELSRADALDRVRFVPPAPHAELAEWTAGATIGVVPYLNIGTNHWLCSPNKLWEYPNAGVPLLTSRLAYLTRMLEEHGIGWTFSSDPTPADIAMAVRGIDDADLAEKRRACARFIERSNYTLHEARLLELFDGLARREAGA